MAETLSNIKTDGGAVGGMLGVREGHWGGHKEWRREKRQGTRGDTRGDTGGDTKERRGSTGLKIGSAAVPHSPTLLPPSSALFAPHRLLWGHQLSPRMRVAGVTNKRLPPFWEGGTHNSVRGQSKDI